MRTSILLLVLACGVAVAEESLQATLRKPVTAEFVETPVSAVLDYLQDSLGIPIILDPNAMDQGVTAKFEKSSLSDALDEILAAAELAWVAEDGVVFVAERSRINSRRMVLRTYPIADLVDAAEEFGGGRMGEIRSDGWEAEETEPSSIVDVDMLVDMIMSGIMPESWDEETVRIDWLPGLLVVRNLPEVHVHIERLLERLRDVGRSQVEVSVWYLGFDRASLKRALGDGVELGGEILVDAAGLERLLAAGAVSGQVSMLGFNAHRFTGMSGFETRALGDFDVEVASSAYAADPIVTRRVTGLQLDVRPLANPKDGEITLELRLDAVQEGAESRLVPAVAGSVKPASTGGKESEAVMTAASIGVDGKLELGQLARDSLDTVLTVPADKSRVIVRGGGVTGTEVAVLIVSARSF